MKLFVLAACSVFLVSTEVTAQQRQSCTGPQLGTWKLETYTITDVATGQKTNIFGAHPFGYISYDSDCRMYTIITEEGRQPPASAVATDAEALKLYRGLISYAGKYSIDGDKIRHYVDASWNQAATETTLLRTFRIDGRTLYIQAMSAKNALTGKESFSELTWTKVE